MRWITLQLGGTDSPNANRLLKPTVGSDHRLSIFFLTFSPMGKRRRKSDRKTRRRTTNAQVAPGAEGTTKRTRVNRARRAQGGRLSSPGGTLPQESWPIYAETMDKRRAATCGKELRTMKMTSRGFLRACRSQLRRTRATNRAELGKLPPLRVNSTAPVLSKLPPSSR
jgi:hypothetical protein